MKVKAHKTVYGGTMFRSRLEATWAALFDIEGLPWAYEPIDLEGWTPDFALWLERPVYVEVKPAPLRPIEVMPNVSTLDSSYEGFTKARRHQGDVDVLLLGMMPNDHADYFGIGTLLDPPGKLPWWPLHDRLTVHGAKAKWGAALAATQWVPQ
jgi:hypothetical protein